MKRKFLSTLISCMTIIGVIALLILFQNCTSGLNAPSVQAKPSSITFGSNASSSGDSPSSCIISTSTCRKYPADTGVFADNYNGAGSSESQCWQRARDYQSWCQNSTTDTVQSFYNVNSVGQSVSNAPSGVIEKLQGSLSLFPTYPSFSQVLNSNYQPLPKDWTALTDNFAAGGAGQVTPGERYGTAAAASNSAFYIIPPASTADFTKLTFPIGFNPELTWYLNYHVGILSHFSQGGALLMQVVASGDVTAANEAPWEILYSQIVTAGADTQISVPLGLWAMRAHANFAIQVQKVDTAPGQPGLVLDGLNIAPAISRPASGIARSNLVWASPADREAVVSGIATLGASWFRDGFFEPINGVSDFVDLVSRVKGHGLKMLAIVTQSPEDYDTGENAYINGGSSFQKLCGWSTGALPLSTINLTKFSRRLSSQFAALRAAGLTVEAFEIGNEFDWSCFNGDVPYGHDASAGELNTVAQAYAAFLRTAINVIHEPQYFPNAKILTFGLANQPATLNRGFHLKNPAAMIAMLRNLNGKNYLQNVDAYGAHIYPDANDAVNSGRAMLQSDVDALGTDRPFWVTEWGFGTTAFPNQAGKTRSQVIEDFLGMLNSQYSTPIGPEFFYAYSSPGENYGLLDQQGNLLPEASVFAERYRF